MLSARLNRPAGAVLALLALPGLTLAQAPVNQDFEAPTISEMRGPKLSPEEQAQITALTELLKSNAAAAASDPKAQAESEQIRRRIDDISNKQMASDRDKILKFMKIDPQSQNQVYIFVSWSMPLDMLRAYALEAMWTGGFLVFKGIPPGHSLTDFFIKDLRSIVYDKGAAAAISVDPRLFDIYSVNVAPTIVFSTERTNPFCANAGEHPVAAKGPDGKPTTVSYKRCPKMDPSKYWKMAGAVTVDYALQAFQSSGATEVAPLLDSLSRGYQGDAPAKEQKPFRGNWKDAPAPDAGPRNESDPR